MKDLIFDLDGTLWNSTSQIETVWKNIAQSFNIDISNINIKSIMGLTNDEIIYSLFHANEQELGKQFLKKCQDEEVKYLSNHGGNIYLNTIETIKKLKEKYNLYIVSNCQSGYIEAFLKYYSLQEDFIDTECSGNTNQAKSNNIKLLMSRNGFEVATYIGDTVNDYEAAKEVNLKFIWASYGFGKCNQFDDKIDDISDLLKKKI